MRIDVFLKKTLIINQREMAKGLCARGFVKINGSTAKPAKELKEGDIIEIETFDGIEKYKVLQVPAGNVKKDEVELYVTRQ